MRYNSSRYNSTYIPEHPRATPNGQVKNCILIVEKVIEKHLALPALVHHINEDEKDDSNANLVVCEDENYHRLIHARTRIVRTGGDPDKDSVCSKCGPKPRKEFYIRYARQGTYYSNKCKSCSSLEATENRIKRLSHNL